MYASSASSAASSTASTSASPIAASAWTQNRPRSLHCFRLDRGRSRSDACERSVSLSRGSPIGGGGSSSSADDVEPEADASGEAPRSPQERSSGTSQERRTIGD